MLLELGDQVLADGEEEKAVAEGERVRCTPGYSDSNLRLNIKFEEVSIFISLSYTHPHDLSKIRVLRHEGEVHEALDEQGKGDQVEENQIEDVLPVLLQVHHHL